METPLYFLEAIVKELTGQPTVFFALQHPCENELRVLCTAKSEVEEMDPGSSTLNKIDAYALAVFSTPSFEDGVPPFLKKEGEWWWDDRTLSVRPTILMLHDWVQESRSIKLRGYGSSDKNLREPLIPTPAKSYLHLLSEKGRDKVRTRKIISPTPTTFDYDVFSAAPEELREFLACQEGKGRVEYHLWTPKVTYALKGELAFHNEKKEVTYEPCGSLSLNGSLGGETDSMKEEMRRIEIVVNAVQPYEKQMLDSLKQAILGWEKQERSNNHHWA